MRIYNLPPKALYLALLIALPGVSQAGGFGITVQSASGGGTAATGQALAEDASAMYYNPALLSSLEGAQINTGVGLLNTDTKLTNRNSTIPTAAGGTLVKGNNTAEPGGLSVTPNFYYKRDLSDKVALGLGINTPFGVSSEYDADSFTRYEALESHLKTVNINPALSWKVNDKVAVGAGVNLQLGEAELGKAIDSRLVCMQISPASCAALGLTTSSNQATDSKVTVKADGVAYGANVGLAYHPDEKTTVSLAYRSPVKYNLEGDADFSYSSQLQNLGPTALTAANLVDQKATADLKMPASASLAVAHKVNDKLAIHGDATWTEWSSVPEIRIKFPDTNLADSVTDLQWENTVRVGGGVTYQMNEKTKLRAGVAFDPTPTPDDKHRSPRAPSSDNWWYSAGVSRKLSKNMDLEASLSYVKPEDTTINYTTPGTSDYNTRADVTSDVLAGAVSINYRF